MQNQVKKAWQQPALEVLNVNMTMAGPGIKTPDGVQPDPTEVIHFS
ncbi:paeninodin family lasso peptide [Paenibacillus sp. LHD-38]|nr:paeninodin family lasso peptide [Paenibacillus sp. LHD-38]MDQ8735962.1 paeninodin family lasso peptide [Paenibacillus sp. LHD-38]